MPTIILLDVSLSMQRTVVCSETNEEYQLRQLAIGGIHNLLDHLSAHCKLEFVAVVAFSSQSHIASTFTRDFESVKQKLVGLEECDKTCIGEGLQGVNHLVLEEWGSGIPCHVLLVTDDGHGIGHNSLKHFVDQEYVNELVTFPCKLNVLCLAESGDDGVKLSQPLYQKLIDKIGGEGEVYFPEGKLSPKNVQQMFTELAKVNYQSFRGTLHCGNLSAPITLCPPPQPYSKAHDFEIMKCNVSENIHICGFLELAEVASPAALSRHLVFPLGGNKDSSEKMIIDCEADEETVDDGKVPSLCVVLHGALKIENMAALCKVSDEWFGILYSWADNRKKSNLMLSLFEPGNSPVPWLGDLRRVGPVTELPRSADSSNSFPIRCAEKKSYSLNLVIWIRQSGLQSDIQKLLRHARKMPEKTAQFYKEVNRIRRAALAYGFHELLNGLAEIFDRECTLLPGSAHPDCALQLSHTANVLRGSSSRDLKFNITALQTTYRHDHHS